MIRKLMLGATVAASAFGFTAPLAGAGDWAKEWTLRSTKSAIESNRSAVRETRDAVNDVRLEVRESADRIIAALRGHSGEQSAYQDKQIEASRRITDAAQQNDSQRLRQEFRAKAESGENDSAPGLCVQAGLHKDGGPASKQPIGTSVAGAAAAASGGADPSVRAGGTALVTSVVTDREKYAELMGYSDPTVDPAVILEQPTLPMKTPEDRAAVERLIRNMTDPLPPRPVTGPELLTPAGQDRAAMRTVEETRIGAAREALAMVMNMRSEVGSSEGFQPYIEDISGYNRPVGEQLSELQQIDIRTLSYYAPKSEVFAERGTLSEKGLLQLMVDQMSVGNRIAYLQLELDTRRAVVETQILSRLLDD